MKSSKAQVHGRFHRIPTLRFEDSPPVPGTFRWGGVTFTIGADGTVSAFEVLSREHKGTYAEACFSYVIKAMRFPRARKARNVPRLPFKLGCATR